MVLRRDLIACRLPPAPWPAQALAQCLHSPLCCSWEAVAVPTVNVVCSDGCSTARAPDKQAAHARRARGSPASAPATTPTPCPASSSARTRCTRRASRCVETGLPPAACKTVTGADRGCLAPSNYALGACVIHSSCRVPSTQCRHSRAQAAGGSGLAATDSSAISTISTSGTLHVARNGGAK